MGGRAQRWTRIFAALVVLCGCATEEFPTDDVEAPVCHTVVTTQEIATTNIDLTDVLFVVDNGPSMIEEQATLQRELPRLLKILVTGERPPAASFAPLPDLHVGVVSADMGAAGVDSGIPNCSAWGDDAILLHAPTMDGCANDYPPFLAYSTAPLLGAPQPMPSPDALAGNFNCIATFGTDGCGYAQPLEAALKALWPSVDVDPDGNVVEPNRILFLGDATGAGYLGRGDRENAGFLRNNPIDGISLIGIVVVTDKDDCSAAVPDFALDPRSGETPDARCAERQNSLYKVERYVLGLQALRLGNENLVTFGAITGVPPDLVSEAARSRVDFSDERARDTYYDGVLADPRMQYARQSDGSLAPACENDHARATPARRLVETARRFGASANLVSICDDDWSAIVGLFVGGIAIDRGAICLPRPLPRDAHGLTDCTVTWELPLPGHAPKGTPTSCDEVPNLLTLNTPHPVSERGGVVCKVHQLAVTSTGAGRAVEPGYGWYFDDFSDYVLRDCSAATPQNIAFSEGAKLPTGVVAHIECHDTRYLFPASGELAYAWPQPKVFDACDPDAPGACDRALQDIDFRPAGLDHALYCHPARRQCVPVCVAGACPEGWRCIVQDPAWCEPLECRVPG